MVLGAAVAVVAGVTLHPAAHHATIGSLQQACMRRPCTTVAHLVTKYLPHCMTDAAQLAPHVTAHDASPLQALLDRAAERRGEAPLLLQDGVCSISKVQSSVWHHHPRQQEPQQCVLLLYLCQQLPFILGDSCSMASSQFALSRHLCLAVLKLLLASIELHCDSLPVRCNIVQCLLDCYALRQYSNNL